MPYLTHQIGSLFFINATGEPAPVRQRVNRLVRPGVDYARYRLEGYGSEPFTIDTMSDVASISAGRTLFTAYESLVGAGVQNFVLKGHSFFPYGVVVLDVTQRQLTSVLHIAGRSFNSSNTAILRAQWTLEFKLANQIIGAGGNLPAVGFDANIVLG